MKSKVRVAEFRLELFLRHKSVSRKPYPLRRHSASHVFQTFSLIQEKYQKTIEAITNIFRF